MMNEKEKLIRDPTPKKRNNFRLSPISELTKQPIIKCKKKESLGSHLAFFNSRKMDWYNEKKKENLTPVPPKDILRRNLIS